MGANLLGMPAAWFIAPLLAALVFALVRGSRPFAPPRINIIILGTIGAAISSSFQQSSLGLIARDWWVLALLAGITLAISLGGGGLVARLSRLDPATAALGALPGGAAGMVAMSDELHADGRLVAFMQYLRLLIVIATTSLVAQIFVHNTNRITHGAAPVVHASIALPWWQLYPLSALIAFVGTWLGIRLHLPAGALVGAALLGVACGAFGIPHGALPPGVLPAAYLLNGLRIGSLFDIATLRRAGKLTLLMVAFTLALISGCMALAWLLQRLTGIDGLTAFLATTAGGIDTSGIIALDTGSNVPFVVTMQLVRLLTIVLIGPIFIQRSLRAQQAAQSA